MAFVELQPQRLVNPHVLANIVKVYFCYKLKNKKHTNLYYLVIRIGLNLAEKVGIKLDDRVSFSYDEENKRTWLIKPVGNYKYKIGGKSSKSCLTLQIEWNSDRLFKPEQNEIGTRYVESEIFQGGILIHSDQAIL